VQADVTQIGQLIDPSREAAGHAVLQGLMAPADRALLEARLAAARAVLAPSTLEALERKLGDVRGFFD